MYSEANHETEDVRRLTRKLKAVRAGTLAHQQHPEHARLAGAAGGRATVAKNPQMRSSAWGRTLVAARELKRSLARVASERNQDV